MYVKFFQLMFFSPVIKPAHCVHLFPPLVRATCPAHHIILCTIILITYSDSSSHEVYRKGKN